MFQPRIEDARIREALALAVDRAAIHNVLLQRQGEVSGALLPQWLSGYAFLFPGAADLARARSLLSAVPAAARRVTLGVEDAAWQPVAERISLNARDAGLTVALAAGRAAADARLVEARFASPDPARALADLAAALALPEPARAGSPEALYAAESALLEGFRVIPLFHLARRLRRLAARQGRARNYAAGRVALPEPVAGRRAAMMFRTRLLLIFTLAVVASVGMVEWVVSVTARRAFETLEGRRVDALVTQFRREYQRRGGEIARAVNGVAASAPVMEIAMASDYSAYYGEAASLAAAHGLDLLELVAGDGAIISSAEWPARFGYKEDWLAAGAWNSGSAFLRREELPDGFTLALVAVGTAAAGDRKLYVAGGQRLDRDFLSTLTLPAGMRVLLYRNFDPRFAPADLIESGGVPDPAQAERLRPIVEQVVKRRAEMSGTVGAGEDAETFHALPLNGAENDLLGVLLIGSSRRELAQVEAFLRWTGIIVAMAGILLGIALSWWATARITRPVRKLVDSAEKVAAGNWGATVEAVSADEIGQLARAFNRMTRELVAQRERLVQAERVAAWRELARRLAHELKNPLFPLQITVENMQRARASHPEQFDEVFREGAATLLAELANLKQIVARFSDFAKMPAPEMQPVDFNKLAADALKLLEPQLAKARHRAEAGAGPQRAPRAGRPGTDDPRAAQPGPERHRRHAGGRRAHRAHHRAPSRRAPGGFGHGAGAQARRMRAPVHPLLHHQDLRHGPGPGDRAIRGERPPGAHLRGERAGEGGDVPDRFGVGGVRSRDRKGAVAGD